MKVYSYSIAVLSSVFLLLGCGAQPQGPASQLQEAPDERNDPSRLGIALKPISEIRSRGEATQTKTWSGSYWPSYRLGIVGRWQDGWPVQNPFQFRPASLAEVMAMNAEQRNRLSPAEKFDLITGNADFPVSSFELGQSRLHWSQNAGRIPEWFGICDGWAIASVLLPEPRKTIQVETPFGFDIDIYPSDLKGILSFFFARTIIYTRVVGGRCNQQVVETDASGRPLRPECRDLNAATFHLALDDIIGRQGRPMIVDIQPGHEVWNQPVTRYQFTYSNFRNLDQESSYPHAARGTVFLIDVSAQLGYTSLSQPQYEPVGTRTSQIEMRYTLEMDADRKIIGGEWISNNHPDFIWEVLTFESVPRRVPTMRYETLLRLAMQAR